MEYTYRLNGDDYIEYTRYMSEGNKDYKAKIKMQGLFAALMIIALGVVYTLTIVKAYYFISIGISVVGAVAVYLLFPSVIKLGQKQAVLSAIRRDKKGELYNEQTIKLDENGMTVVSGEDRVEIPRDKLAGTTESDNLIYVNFSDGNLMMIPKRVIGIENIERFKEAAKPL